jgi:hypothetical protein
MSPCVSVGKISHTVVETCEVEILKKVSFRMRTRKAFYRRLFPKVFRIDINGVCINFRGENTLATQLVEPVVPNKKR